MIPSFRGTTDYLDHPPTPDVFAKYVDWNRPLVFRGLHDQIARGNAFDLDFLGKALGERTVEIVRSPSRKLYWDPEKRFPYDRATFDEFRRIYEAESFDGPRTYMQDDIGNFPELRQHFEDPPYFTDRKIRRRKLWVSGAGLTVPLHYDPVEQLHWLARGKKTFVCFRPGLRDYYPFGMFSKGPFMSQVDAEAPDLEAFPRFARTTAVEIVLEAGDVMYVPPFWWHQVRSEDPLNVSINWAWFANPSKIARYLPVFGHCFFHLMWQGRRVAAAAKANPDPRS